MSRHFVFGVLAFALFTPPAPAQEGIQKGTIKKVDAEKGTITIAVDGKERDFSVSDKTKIFDPAFKEIEEGLKDKRFKAGAAVMFKPSGEGTMLAGLKLGAGNDRPNPSNRIQRGKIKKIDTAKMILILTVEGKDLTLTVTEKTRFIGAEGELKDGLKDKAVREGAAVMFMARKDGDNTVLIGMRLGAGDRPPIRPLEKVDTSKLKPLTEMGDCKYKTFQGGLYPDGKNERPTAHDRAGLALAGKVQPLDADGKASADGKIVLLSVGMSNTTQEFSTFKGMADVDRAKNPRLVIVDGAQGGMTAAAIQDANKGRGPQFWSTVDRRLKAAGVSRAQVQVAWIKEADAGPRQGFPKYAQTLQEELGNIVRLMKARFPNLNIVYLSSRICAAFAKTGLNPEPYAYESGFSVKWLIEQQIKGEKTLSYTSGKAPWMSWGPYLWTNGVVKRADGLTYEESDFANDGTHPSRSGQDIVGKELLKFFKKDTTARPWFLRKEE